LKSARTAGSSSPFTSRHDGDIMDSVEDTYVPKEERYFADMDHERPFDENIVGLTQTDEITGFSGNMRIIKELDYIYLYMDIGDDDFVFSEGIVIKSPYPSKPYKWCCKLLRPIEYVSDYSNRRT
jgi:hypothetical protein